MIQTMGTTQSSPAAESGAAAKGAGRELLTFRLGGEEYGIDILKVQEIRGWETPTAIANAPAFIKGVISLRGTIVPVVDLRLKFNLGEAKYDETTVMIILNLSGRVVGGVVDGALHRRTVQLGGPLAPPNEQLVEVLSGLSDGEQVALPGGGA